MTDVWEQARGDGLVISTDRSRLDVPWILDFLKNESYWAAKLDRAVLEKSIHTSLPFGLYDPVGRQMGFARVLSDKARYAWLSDVFVDTGYRGRRLGV